MGPAPQMDCGGVGRWGWLVEAGEVGAQGVVGLAGDVALQAAHDFGLCFALSGAAAQVGACAWAVAQAADGDQVQCSVGLPVAAVQHRATRAD
jgi:hypothetical protein